MTQLNRSSSTSHLILGGARSGKSSYAEKLAKSRALKTNRSLVYLATATADDEEMRVRIQQHQQDRDDDWHLIEEALNPINAIESLPQPSTIVIDCLTLWLANCLEHTPSDWPHYKVDLIKMIKQAEHDVFMVSNEIGLGVVPLGEATRKYVDELGRLHQELAQAVKRVTLMVAGLPQPLK